MWQLMLLAVGILRIITPPFVLLYPAATTLALIILDSVDGYVAFRAGWRHRRYHTWDKILDWWWYVFIFIWSVDEPVFPVVFILFTYRSAGQIISLSMYNVQTLALFPNILENYFIGYIATKLIPTLGFLYEGNVHILTIVFATFIALGREYLIHIKKLFAVNWVLRLGLDWSRNEPKP